MPEQFRYLKLLGGAWDSVMLQFPVEIDLEKHFFMPRPDGHFEVYEFVRVVNELVVREGYRRRAYVPEYRKTTELKINA